MNDEFLTVSLGDRSYDIFFGTGVYPLFQEWVARFFRGEHVFVVTDRTVFSIYGDDIRKWLSGFPHDVLPLPPGETGKNGDAVREIYSFLAGGGAGRNSLVVAFGGGVVGDLAGFAAATFHRGMPYVQVPTTLLSQVDSSVGGKTGYNLPEGKNLVGAFHQPRAVFIDPGFLLTLDARNLRAGMAEVVKCAFAGDASLLESIASRADAWNTLSGDEWIRVIRSAVAFKARVVERDEREASARRILNLGHTIGHAMEQASGYGRLLHGEAVAMGLAWEGVFSRRQGVTPPGLERRMIDLLATIGFALDDPGLPLPKIAAAIGMDKKRFVSDIEMPLLTGPGSCVLKRIPVSELREDLSAVREEVRAILRERSVAAGREETLPPPEAEIPAPDDVRHAIPALERRLVEDPRDLEAMIALSVAYRRAGNRAGAWDTIKEALNQYPSSGHAQRIARDIEREMQEALSATEEGTPPLLEDVVILDEGAFELRPADGGTGPAGEEDRAGDSTWAEAPREDDASPEVFPGEPVSAVRTVTMASVYWNQGRQAEARRIIEEILRDDPQNLRALAWLKEREEKPAIEPGRKVISALTDFFEKIAREFGYDIPRPH